MVAASVPAWSVAAATRSLGAGDDDVGWAPPVAPTVVGIGCSRISAIPGLPFKWMFCWFGGFSVLDRWDAFPTSA
jgi:hypothetical protein